MSRAIVCCVHANGEHLLARLFDMVKWHVLESDERIPISYQLSKN